MNTKNSAVKSVLSSYILSKLTCRNIGLESPLYLVKVITVTNFFWIKNNCLSLV